MNKKVVILVIVCLVFIVVGYVYFDKYSTLSFKKEVESSEDVQTSALINDNTDNSNFLVGEKQYNINLEKEGNKQTVKINGNNIYNTTYEQEAVVSAYSFKNLLAILSCGTSETSCKLSIKDLNGNLLKEITSINYGRFKMHVSLFDDAIVVDDKENLYVTFDALTDGTLMLADGSTIKGQIPYNIPTMIKNNITNDTVISVTYKISYDNGVLSDLQVDKTHSYKEFNS